MELISSLGANRDFVLRRDHRRQFWSQLFRGLMMVISFAVVALVVGLIGTIVVKGAGKLNWEFLTQRPAEFMAAGGIGTMVKGSLLLLGGTLLVVLPLGILGGIFLAEYAGRSKWVDTARALTTSLAGTPSIVYGLFGLAIFVLMFKLNTSLLAGWLTLGMMAIPVVVLNTEQAIRSVPSNQIDAAIGLGMTRWQTMAKVVIPQAMPGILTGIVLASGRAAGEAPPILLTAGIFYATSEAPFGWQTLREPVMNLPYHLSEGYRQPKTVPEDIVWGTCLVLVLMVLLVNLAAIIVRARLRRRRTAS